jgi:Flp pilus assembly protein TadD
MNLNMLKTAGLGASLVAIASIAVPSAEESWPAKLAKLIPLSERLKYRWGAEVRPVSEAHGQLKVTAPDPNFYVFENGVIRSLSGAEAESWMKRRQEQEKAVGKALTLLQRGSIRSARAILEPLVRENGTDEIAVCALARASLRQGQFREALTLLTPLVNAQASEEILLFAAYAGAMINRVFDSQQEFGQQIIHQAAGGMSGAAASMPNASGAAGVKQTILLALASWYAMAGDDVEAYVYLTRFLLMQPRNAWANFLLGGIHQRRGQWRQASDAFAIAASSSSGDLKVLATQERDAAAIRAKSSRTHSRTDESFHPLFR